MSQELLDELHWSCSSCTKCGLSSHRTLVVSGDGPVEASIMIVGEAPGAQEDMSGLPFQGKAGELLDFMLLTAGIERKEVYITNVVKCRPFTTNGKKTKNRVPSELEIRECLGWLVQEIALVKPKVIITCGKTATVAILEIDVKSTMSLLVGNLCKSKYGNVMPTWHPSYLMQYGKDKINDNIKYLKEAAKYVKS